MNIETANADELEDEQAQALAATLLASADDEHAMGNRLSDWTGVAPTIEEDVAISNVAQDELGHAELLYEEVGELLDATVNELAYERGVEELYNARLVEAPHGDWAQTIARHYCYDVADRIRLESMLEAEYDGVDGLLEKMLEEEEYHLEHGEVWIETLVDDPDGAERLQAALEDAWPEALAVFEPIPDAPDAVEAGIYATSPDEQREAFIEEATATFEAAGLEVPAVDAVEAPGREGDHDEAFGELVEETRDVYQEGVDIDA